MLTLPDALPLPKRSAPNQDMAFLHSGTLQHWLDVHLKDDDQAAERLLTLLQEINRSQLAFDLLCAHAPLLYPAIQTVSQRFEQHFATYPFPLPATAYSRAAMAREILIEFALLHKRIAAEATDESALGGAIENMVRLLGRVLFQSSLLYLSPPSGIWRELHGLLQITERLPLALPEHGATLSEYLRILTFAAAAPHRMRPEEMIQIQPLLIDWCQHVRLAPVGRPAMEMPSLLIDLEADTPAQPATVHQDQTDGQRYRRLDLSTLQTHLRSMAEHDPQALPIPFPLFKKLIQAFGATPVRGFFRVQGTLALQSFHGIKGVHEQIAQPSDKGVVSLRLVNESATGYCVEWDDTVPHPICIGEIAGIRQERAPDRLSVGVIRWMRNSIVDSPRVGIEILSSRVQAVNVDNGTEAGMEALLLPAVRATGRPQTLILPAARNHSGDRLLLADKGGASPILLTRLLESTPIFDHYQFDTLQNRQ